MSAESSSAVFLSCVRDARAARSFEFGVWSWPIRLRASRAVWFSVFWVWRWEIRDPQLSLKTAVEPLMHTDDH
jgi:hypothetical protein